MIHIERKWTIILAVILGLLAVFLTNVYFSSKEQQYKFETQAVLVAAKEIAKGSVIGYDVLALSAIPVKYIQPGALREKAAAVGKTAEVTIMSGEQVLSTKLTTPGHGLTLAGKTPPGKRAMTITTDALDTMGGMIKPGDHVDLLATFKAPAPVVVTLFQDVLVLAVGSQMVAQQGQDDAGKGTTTRSRKETITLAISPQEVQILTVALEHGRIQLTLRPQMEKRESINIVDLSNLPQVVDLNTLLQFYIRRPKVDTPQVEVIRGLKKEVTPVPTQK